ncbi:MAG TPA: ABC transporter ATP-binding protein [Gemmatimonadaceae bacterium]
MSEVAILCSHIGKQYRIGERESYGSLREAITNRVTSPFRRLGSPRREPEMFWALSDVSLEVKHGEVIGIIGRNGAGKSTMLKILARITKPTTGTAMIHGRIGSLLEIGTGFHPELTGRENIFLNAAILGMRKAEVERKFDEIVAFAEVERFIDTPVKRYSSGMYVRLAFAVAAHLEPEILLIDEVLAVGDAAFQKKCLGKMRDAAGHGRTILFVSHNLGAIQNLCDRGVVLDHGQAAFQGTADEAVGYYHRAILDSDGRGGSMEPHVLFDESARDGQEEITVTRIEIRDLDGAPLPLVSTWDDVAIRITVRSRTRIERGSVVLQLMTAEGTKVLTLSTQPDGRLPLPIQPGEQSVECVIKRLPLAAGDYIVGAGVAIPHVQWLSWQPELAKLRVCTRDVYGSGIAPATSRSLIAVDHDWRVV